MERLGIARRCSAPTRPRSKGEGAREALRLADGRVLPADLVVVAVGVRPNADLARAAGLAVKRGILVDDGLETYAPGVYAIGECAEHRGHATASSSRPTSRPTSWPAGSPARTRAMTAALLATSLKVSGVPVFSAGRRRTTTERRAHHALATRGAGVYRKLVIRDDRLVGALLVGDVADGPWYLDLIRSGEDVTAFRHDLMFGRRAAAAADAGR